jgi:ADP-ribose pyrophosphatase YjhB (NUDIX family)
MHHFCKVRSRAIIIHDKKLLVVDHGHAEPFFALPGGHLDPGEDPLTCIRREIEEELGVAPIVGRLLFVYSFFDREGVQSIEFLFEVVNASDFVSFEKHARSHAHEIHGARWISQEDTVHLLPEQILSEFQQDTIVSDKVRFITGESLDNTR